MDNQYVRATHFLSDIERLQIEKCRFKDNFSFDETDFYWVLNDLFFSQYGRGSVNKQNVLYEWNKYFFYNDPRMKKEIGLPDTMCLLFNTSFSRSSLSENSSFLSLHFKNLEKAMQESDIAYSEYCYMDSRSYARINPYQIFNSSASLPFNAAATDWIYEEETRAVEKAKEIKRMLNQKAEELLSKPCKEFGFEIDKARDALDISLGRGFPEAVRDYHTMRRIIQLTNAKIVFILGHEDRHNIAAILAARKCGIKTIEMHHGILPQLPIYPKDYPFPDKVCVDGKRDYDRYVEAGFGKERVVITGRPRYDKLAEFAKEANPEEIQEKYALPANNRILLWAVQTHDPTMSQNEENEVNAEKVFDTMSRLPDWHLIVKLHPDEDQKAPLYRKMAKKYGLQISIFDKKADTNELIMASEAVMMKISTVGVDAVLLGKPVILLEFLKSHSLEEFSRYGFEVISSTEQLVGYLGQLGTEEAKKEFEKRRESFIEERAANFGHASEAVVEVIAQMIEQAR